MPALIEDRRRSGFRAVLAGTMIRKQERRGRNDQPYGFLSLSDPTGMFEVMVFSEVLVGLAAAAGSGQVVLLITVGADWDRRRVEAARAVDLRSRQGRGRCGRGPAHLSRRHAPLNAIAGQLRSRARAL